MESGLEWSLHEGLAGESAEAIGLDFPLTGKAVKEKK